MSIIDQSGALLYSSFSVLTNDYDNDSLALLALVLLAEK